MEVASVYLPVYQVNILGFIIKVSEKPILVKLEPKRLLNDHHLNTMHTISQIKCILYMQFSILEILEIFLQLV